MEQINENFEEKEIKWGGWLNEFLWWCAGVNKKIIRQCPTDYAKYAGTGGTILFTALMAMLSGGYALFSVFSDPEVEVQAIHTYVISILFGIFWGLLIFNLDRFMVNTMYSDGTPEITKEEIRGGLPRIILAIFLGVVISTPIELKIFDDYIQVQIIKDQGIEAAKMSKSNKTVADQIKQLEDQKASNNARVDKKREEAEKIKQQAYEEATGIGGSKKVGIGIYTKQLEIRAANLEREAKVIEKESSRANETIDKQLAELYKQSSKITGGIAKTKDAMKGLTAKIQALFEVTSPFQDKEKGIEGSWTLFFARLCVMLLFIAIEVIPTFFKMMMSSGEYDDILRAEKHEARVMSDKKISDINDDINTKIQISTMKNKYRLEAEVKANQEVLDRIALAQAELLQVAIDTWREEELAKIQANPSAYIRTNMSEQESQINTI